MSFRITRQLTVLWSSLRAPGPYARAVGELALVRLGGGFVLLVSQILLARWMGPENFGIYSYAWAWVAVLAPLAGLGLGSTSVRYVADYRVTGQAARIRGLLRFGTVAVLACASAVVLTGLIFVWLAGRDSPYQASLAIAFLAIPALALLGLDAALARGFSWMAMSALAEQIGRPVLLILLGGLWIAIGGARAAPRWVALCAAAYWIATLAQHLGVRRRIAHQLGKGPSEFDTKNWMRVSIALLLLGTFQMIRMNTDLILVGALLGPAEVGVYTAAVRVATLVGFVLMVSSVAAQPRMAALHAQGRRDELRSFVRASTRSILVASLAIGVTIAVSGRWVLALFGPGFASGYAAMLVLVSGHVLAAATGPLTSLLAMTDHHDRAAAVHGLSTLTGAVLVAVLASRFGVMGAALAASLNLVLTQSALMIQARRLLDRHSR